MARALSSVVLALLTVLVAGCGPSPERIRDAEQIVKNDARQIGASASQYFLEHQEVKSVVFSVDSAGATVGPLREWMSRPAKGVRVVSGKIERSNGKFTL